MNDERLARRAAAGDRRAFEVIFKRYHQDLYRFCLATLGNPQDAQDALQNTMVKALRALPGEKREIKLKPWLYRVARNEALEVLRRQRVSVELEPEALAANGEIVENAAARERLRTLLADLEQLPERQRTTLMMRELAGLEFTEIGDAFGTTPAVARQTLYEARQGLSQMEGGREMSCEGVRRTLSDADGRVTRRRDLRAHLRSCGDCRAFQEGIARRRDDFAAIVPLPLAVSTGLLQGALGQAGVASGAGGASLAAGGGGGAGAIGVGAAKIAATSTLVKSGAATLVVAAVGVTAADHGTVDLRGGDRTAGPTQSVSQGPASPDRSDGATPTASADHGWKGSGKRQVVGSNGGRVAPPALADTPGRTADTNGRAVAPDRSSAPAAGGPNGPSEDEADGGDARGQPVSTQGEDQAGGDQSAESDLAGVLPPASDGSQRTASGRKPPQAGSPPVEAGRPGGEAPPAPANSGLPASAKPEGTPGMPPLPEQAQAPAALNGGGSKGKGLEGREPGPP